MAAWVVVAGAVVVVLMELTTLKLDTEMVTLTPIPVDTAGAVVVAAPVVVAARVVVAAGEVVAAAVVVAGEVVAAGVVVAPPVVVAAVVAAVVVAAAVVVVPVVAVPLTSCTDMELIVGPVATLTAPAQPAMVSNRANITAPAINNLFTLLSS